MQTFVVEARRHEDGPWAQVTTVQEDLVDVIAPQIPDGPGDWRIRSLDEPKPKPQAASLPLPTRRERLRWWLLMRFTRKARR